MSNIDIDTVKAMKWVNENSDKMTLDDQLKMLKTCLAYMDTVKELYKKYNKPEPNTFFFKL